MDPRQPVSVEALEGAKLNLSCSHPSASTDNIFCYRQFPNRGPEFIVTGFSGTSLCPDPEGTLHISKDKENSTLSLPKVWLADAAVYYCARSDTVGQPGVPPPYNKSPTPGLVASVCSWGVRQWEVGRERMEWGGEGKKPERRKRTFKRGGL
uniref:Immunoglobulin V-set domain-containing protein n=1 Tax=Chelonoidis abingdonii TaxID=106734 RepID=A0A8C0GV37_CHEAB